MPPLPRRQGCRRHAAAPGARKDADPSRRLKDAAPRKTRRSSATRKSPLHWTTRATVRIRIRPAWPSRLRTLQISREVAPVVRMSSTRTRSCPFSRRACRRPEGVAHVPPSGLRVETELGQGRTRPAEAREHGKVQSSAQGPRQEERLVESPFSPAPRMGRDRHQAGRGEGVGPRLVGSLEQRGQRMGQAAVAGELEAMDQLSQGSGVRTPGPGRVMEGSLPPAGRAGSRSPGIGLPIRKRQVPGRCGHATYRAEAAPEPGQLQEAFGAKGTGIRIGDPAAAKDTALGEKRTWRTWKSRALRVRRERSGALASASSDLGSGTEDTLTGTSGPENLRRELGIPQEARQASRPDSLSS